MRPSFLGTASFRLALGSSAILAAATLLEFSLIYWRTATYEAERADRLLDREAALMAAQPPFDLQEQMRLWRVNGLRLQMTAFGLFDSERRPIGGNLAGWPEMLPVDGAIRVITVHPLGEEVRSVRAEALPVQGDRFLVIGRGVHETQQIQAIVRDAIWSVLIPALLFSLLAGAWLGRRNLARVGRMQQAIDRIMHGDLHERLPVRSGQSDEMERLAASVNRMLDRLGQLLDEIRGVGDDIAHDLRTPLARVQAGLERARRRPPADDQKLPALQEAVDRAVADLGRCFAIVTSLLRLGEIGNERRRAAFASLRLDALAAEIVELYDPVAEAAGNRLLLEPAAAAVIVRGDRDLLVELLANLVDNAIKFTPGGGRIALQTVLRGRAPVLRVSDDGIGIAPGERDAVLRRFYRSDKSRHIAGSGLGLSLVAAIARLHDARLSVLAGDSEPASGRTGTVIELVFPQVGPP